MIYYIQKPDELYHYGVKGMKWGVRHDPERSGDSRSQKGMSTAKKVAIGVAVTAAVAGVAYVGIKTHKANQIRTGRAIARQIHSRHSSKPVSISSIKKGPSSGWYSTPAPLGEVDIRARAKAPTLKTRYAHRTNKLGATINRTARAERGYNRVARDYSEGKATFRDVSRANSYRSKWIQEETNIIKSNTANGIKATRYKKRIRRLN